GVGDCGSNFCKHSLSLAKRRSIPTNSGCIGSSVNEIGAQFAKGVNGVAIATKHICFELDARGQIELKQPLPFGNNRIRQLYWCPVQRYDIDRYATEHCR